MNTILAYDCDMYPLRVGDRVLWLHDKTPDTPEVRYVMGPAETRYALTSPERGYVRVTSSNNPRGYEQRFGMNLRRVPFDVDVVMDDGL